MSTLRTIAAFLAEAVQPLEDALGDPPRFRALLGRFGWRTLTIPPGWEALGAAVAQVRAAADALSDDPQLTEVANIISAVEELADALDGLTTAPPGVDAAAFFAELRGTLIEHLIIAQLARRLPALYGALALIGVIVTEPQAATADRPPFVRHRIDPSAFTRTLADPGALPGRLFAWGGSGFAADVLTDALFELVTRLRLPARLAPVTAPDPARPGLAIGSSLVQVPLLDLVVGGTPLRFGIELGILAPDGAHPPGLSLRLWIPGLNDGTLRVGRYTSLRTRTGGRPGVEVALHLRPDGVTLHLPGGPGGALPPSGVGLDLVVALPPDLGTLGARDGSHLALGGATAGVLVESGAQGVDVTFHARLDGVAARLGAGQQDGLVARLVGGRDLTIPIDAALRWSTRTGAALSIRPGDLSTSGGVTLGPVRVEQLTSTFAAADQRVELGVAASLTVQLGPVAVRLDGAGAGAVFDAAADGGRLGLGRLEVGGRLPIGAGLRIDAGIVRGGGYVARDPAGRRYAGAVQLAILNIEVAGLARLDTPTDRVDVLAWVGARIPSIPLGLGFMLDRLGGLVALHRRPDVARLRRGLARGELTGLLFPDDPVASAGTLLARLDECFPVARDRHVVGPTARIGWGTPRVLQGDLAVLLELPAPIRLVLLGALEIGLPSLQHRIIDLRMDVLGVVDFARRTLALDASLHDSRVAGYELTGDMALRMGWGDTPHFLLALGGFHPRFRQPAGFPALRRLALTVGDNPRLRLEAYLALTSNAVQFGAHVDLRFAIAGLTIAGHLHFDALLELRPFSIDAELKAGVSISYRGVHFASARLELLLTGPRPWHAVGKATIGILWWDVSVGFDVTWGNRQSPALPPPPDVAALLRAALADPSAWTAELPAGERPWIVLREGADGIRVHPLASLSVRQRAVPLDHPITAYGPAPLGRTFRFSLPTIRIAGTLRPAEPVTDLFAPGQFTRLGEHERLSGPSFEIMRSGVRVAGTTVLGATARAAMEHDTVVSDPLAPPRPPLPSPIHITVLTVAAHHRASSAPTALSRPRPGRIHVAPPRFVLASTRDLSITAEAAAVAGGHTTYAGLREALRAARSATLQIVPRAEVSNSRGRVIVIREDDNHRNIDFVDTVTGRAMTRADFVAAIRDGEYPTYTVKRINGVDTPVSRPTPSLDDNLG